MRTARLRSTGSPTRAGMPILLQGELHQLNEPQHGIDDAGDASPIEPAPGPGPRCASWAAPHRQFCAVENRVGLALPVQETPRIVSGLGPGSRRLRRLILDFVAERRPRALIPCHDGADGGGADGAGKTSSGWSRRRGPRRGPWPRRSTSEPPLGVAEQPACGRAEVRHRRGRHPGAARWTKTGLPAVIDPGALVAGSQRLVSGLSTTREGAVGAIVEMVARWCRSELHLRRGTLLGALRAAGGSHVPAPRRLSVLRVSIPLRPT